MPVKARFWRVAAGLNGFMAIAVGAVGAHAIAGAPLAALAEKASWYQLIHAVALLCLAPQQGRCWNAARWMFLIAIIAFCGTLYLKALSVWAGATQLAPFGGICFMAGWLLIALAAAMQPDATVKA